jgi:hypothetical protein
MNAGTEQRSHFKQHGGYQPVHQMLQPFQFGYLSGPATDGIKFVLTHQHFTMRKILTSYIPLSVYIRGTNSCNANNATAAPSLRNLTASDTSQSHLSSPPPLIVLVVRPIRPLKPFWFLQSRISIPNVQNKERSTVNVFSYWF